MEKLKSCLLIFAIFGLLQANAQESASDILQPYDGPSVVGADPTTLTGKVMTGYQGWFNAEGDGSKLGWIHWAKRPDEMFAPGNIAVDIWPDTTELDPDELYPTGFLYADGSVAKTFSSHNRKTVLRHFKWMSEYGIDGAFVQRFTNAMQDPHHMHHKNKVLSSAREGANRYGRTYVVMYDLTGTPDDQVLKVFDDWRMLRDQMKIGDDPAYQHHKGKPLVAVWGVGFNNEIKKRNGFEVCRELVRLFKEDGCSVMLGTPTGWREQNLDATQRPDLHDFLRMADIISPWSVGRFGTLDGAKAHGERYWNGDVQWARENDMDFLPVVFPGFSWHNLMGPKSTVIPRLKGQFLWTQIVATKKAGADMLYIAMFDEVDEATAIFKCTNKPPRGNGGHFIDYEGLPSDFYLQLAQKAGELFRGEIPVTESVPLPTNTE